MSLILQNMVIQFTLANILRFDEIFIEAKKNQLYVKWNYCGSMPLQNLLSLHHPIV